MIKNPDIFVTMTYITEQKVEKYTYVYEAESYWDRQKKQPRKHRRYLGRKDAVSDKVIYSARNTTCVSP